MEQRLTQKAMRKARFTEWTALTSLSLCSAQMLLELVKLSFGDPSYLSIIALKKIILVQNVRLIHFDATF